ncbi:Esterase EstB [Acinetobacter calcoaceticus]|nr:Esterase EstB [Acinetobacter calcoaceticus]
MISTASGSSTTVPSTSLSLVQNVVQKAIDHNQLVGAAVIVAQHRKVIHREALGLSDRERSISITTDTVFRLASVSKVIVSTAALVLVAQNNLSVIAFTNTLYEGMSGKFVTDLRDAVYKAIGVVE